MGDSPLSCHGTITSLSVKNLKGDEKGGRDECRKNFFLHSRDFTLGKLFFLFFFFIIIRGPDTKSSFPFLLHPE